MKIVILTLLIPKIQDVRTRSWPLCLNFSLERRQKERERDELKNALQYKRNRLVTKEFDLESVLDDDQPVNANTRNRQEALAFLAKLKDGGINSKSFGFSQITFYSRLLTLKSRIRNRLVTERFMTRIKAHPVIEFVQVSDKENRYCIEQTV